MFSLLRLPLILLELALRGGAGALKDILRLVGGGADDDERPYVPSPEAEAEAAAAASARRDAERVAAEEAAARRPAARPSAARRRTRPARQAPVAAAPEPPAHVSTEAEPVASFGPHDDPSPTLEVQAPWPGYDEHPASEVVKRVRSGDEATRAVVLLYERTHKRRKSVIAAAETTPS
jgi:hypothetical protein